MLELILNRATIRSGALAALLLALPATGFAQAPDAGNEPTAWPYTFPLFGQKLADRGLQFPLPFGIGLNYAFIDQPIEISKIAVGLNDAEMVDLSDMIVFGDLNSKVHALNLRVDLWVLPFLNLYVMGNYAIDSETAVPVVEPFAFEAGANQAGYGGGFGTTLAGGALGFFGTLDLNWTWNKLQQLDQPVGTFLLAPRIGRNFGKLAGIEWIFWVGAMRQSIQSETRGEIKLSDAVGGDGSFQGKLDAWYDTLPPGRQALVQALVDQVRAGGDPVVHYDIDKAVAYKWNMLVGAELGITREWRVRAEVGFIKRTQVIIGLNYRFGGFLSGADAPPVK